MTLDWNAVTGAFTALSFLAFAITAVAGLLQIRYTRAQLNELSRATQLAGTMQIFADLNEPASLAARRFVWADLPHHLEDEAFVAELELVGLADAARHAELLVLRQFAGDRMAELPLGQQRRRAEHRTHHTARLRGRRHGRGGRGCPSFVSEPPSDAIANDPHLLDDTKTFVANLAAWLRSP